MKTFTTHTPTPWKISKNPVEIRGFFREVIGSNGVPTSILIEEINKELSDRICIHNHEANAEFIMRAINCHEQMLRCLKMILKVENVDSNDALLNAIENIIAKAEGK